MKLTVTIFGDKEVHLTAALRAVTGLVEFGYESGEVHDRESSFRFVATGMPQVPRATDGSDSDSDSEWTAEKKNIFDLLEELTPNDAESAAKELIGKLANFIGSLKSSPMSPEES